VPRAKAVASLKCGRAYKKSVPANQWLAERGLSAVVLGPIHEFDGVSAEIAESAESLTMPPDPSVGLCNSSESDGPATGDLTEDGSVTTEAVGSDADGGV